MKKVFMIFFALSVCAYTTFASGSGEANNFSVETYYRGVSAALSHKLDENEKAVANATYLWYSNKCDKKWTDEIFDKAVKKGAENCRNDAMIAAAKAGKFGEKVLKALIVAAGDASESIGKWVDKNSERYDKAKK